MILNISDNAFKDIFSNKQFQLPIRWDGVDFEKALKELFNEYCFQVCNGFESKMKTVGTSYMVLDISHVLQ